MKQMEKLQKEELQREELQRKIEAARKKLDKAIGNGYDETLCYKLSVELDRLVELYITNENGAEVSAT